MFIELTRQHWDSKEKKYLKGGKFLMDFDSGWEICDKGPGESAHWQNMTLGMNHTVNETYQEIYDQLLNAGMIMGKVPPNIFQRLIRFLKGI